MNHSNGNTLIDSSSLDKSLLNQELNQSLSMASNSLSSSSFSATPSSHAQENVPHSAESFLNGHSSSSAYFANQNGVAQDSKHTLNTTNHLKCCHNGIKTAASTNNNNGDYSNVSVNGIENNNNNNGSSNSNHSSNNSNLLNNNNGNDNNNDNGNYKGGQNFIATANMPVFTSGQKDILRLIGQHLRYLGLDKTTDILVKESGCMLEHPIAANFCQLIMNGNWEEADAALNTMAPIMDESNADITNMKFLILEQKYLENLEDGKILDALKCLRDELAPLKYNIDRLHELSSFLMCSDQMNLKSLSKWSGKNALSRQSLMSKLQSYLPPNIMLPPHRLEDLLNQAITYQCEKCPYHNCVNTESLDSWSFLKDHVCSKEEFPSVTLQIINDHCDEVLICKFSNNGQKLATGSKDGCLFIWDVDPTTYKLTLNKCYEDHTCGVCYVAWSPDDQYLIACGADDSNELWIWDIEKKMLKKRLNNNHDDSLTSAAWLQDSQTFVTGGVKGQFYYCDLDGNIRDTWEGIRVHCLQTLPDGLVLAADKLKRIRSYNFKEISDANLVQEDFPILSFTLNKAATQILISLEKQCLHLWDIKDRCLVHRYQGTVQAQFVSHATFGGVDENFIAGGSEDSRVYIWNKRNENAICILEGHTRPVTCVAWNPVHLGMLASASDDGTVRIWGPKCKLINNTLNKHNTTGISVEHDSNNSNNFKNNQEKLGGSTQRPADPPHQQQQPSNTFNHVQSFASQASTTGNNRSDRSTPV